MNVEEPHVYLSEISDGEKGKGICLFYFKAKYPFL